MGFLFLDGSACKIVTPVKDQCHGVAFAQTKVEPKEVQQRRSKDTGYLDVSTTPGAHELKIFKHTLTTDDGIVYTYSSYGSFGAGRLALQLNLSPNSFPRFPKTNPPARIKRSTLPSLNAPQLLPPSEFRPLPSHDHSYVPGFFGNSDGEIFDSRMK
ncbi:hypothetical protein PMIN01_09071 [Paraphaeosphaeria minitans]|uniref:Uncharacterized protein n=1 Tax=Paraphaeosphaeria minitans TaxID=565426 RepID=A0A9P6KNA1_9PLEO|nr:hypothetical protein PMIN01_09071 [Paraphaeosphaeria minitans]